MSIVGTVLSGLNREVVSLGGVNSDSIVRDGINTYKCKQKLKQQVSVRVCFNSL